MTNYTNIGQFVDLKQYKKERSILKRLSVSLLGTLAFAFSTFIIIASLIVYNSTGV